MRDCTVTINRMGITGVYQLQYLANSERIITMLFINQNTLMPRNMIIYDVLTACCTKQGSSLIRMVRHYIEEQKTSIISLFRKKLTYHTLMTSVAIDYTRTISAHK